MLRLPFVAACLLACSPPAAREHAAAPAAPAPAEDAPITLQSSYEVTWSCAGSPCPFGDTVKSHAIVWPAHADPAKKRLGYDSPPGVYLPAAVANGVVIALATGTATLYAGKLDAPEHRVLATVGEKQPFQVSGLANDEVLSVQAEAPFTYATTLPAPVEAGERAAEPGVRGTVVEALEAVWRCDLPGCSAKDWRAAVISWPAWAAYQNNARKGEQSRSVYSVKGEPLYPYMGRWADGCAVTAVAGVVLIIEWQRGTDVWRETRLGPGERHVIALAAHEDGAMIETLDGLTAFSVALENCEPQPLPGREAPPRSGG